MYEPSLSETLWETATHRVRLLSDDVTSMPENMGGCPVLRVDAPRHRYWEELDRSDVSLVYGTGTLGDESYPEELLAHLDHLAELLTTVLQARGQSAGLPLFAHEVERVFDGDVVTYGPNQATDAVYVAVNTEQLRRWWSGDEPAPTRQEDPDFYAADLDEVRSWLEGEVYLLSVEDRFDVHVVKTLRHAGTGETCEQEADEILWHEIETIGPFYGRETAEEEAAALREHCQEMVARHHARVASEGLGEGCSAAAPGATERDGA